MNGKFGRFEFQRKQLKRRIKLQLHAMLPRIFVTIASFKALIIIDDFVNDNKEP